MNTKSDANAYILLTAATVDDGHARHHGGRGRIDLSDSNHHR
ncbi:MAG: hypothetical protein WAR39_06165 [Prevotella sp.]